MNKPHTPLTWRSTWISGAASRYVLLDTIPPFLLGTGMFLLLLLLFQAIRLMEFVIGNQVALFDVAALSYHLIITFVPFTMPIAFLFSVLMAISRAQSEGELTALQATGTSLRQLCLPLVGAGLIVAVVGTYLALYMAPRSNRAFELLITRLGSEKAVAALKPGVFTSGFFGLTVFAEQVVPVRNELKRVFVYDERDASRPLAVSAQAGVLRVFPEKGQLTLRLLNGSIHVAKKEYTEAQQKIEFQMHDIHLDVSGRGDSSRGYSIPSYTFPQLMERIRESVPNPPEWRKLQVELHRRIALSFASAVFAALGFAIALLSQRGVRSGSVLLCLGIGLSYWLSLLLANALAQKGWGDPRLGVWAPNFVFLGVAWLCYRKYRQR